MCFVALKFALLLGHTQQLKKVFFMYLIKWMGVEGRIG